MDASGARIRHRLVDALEGNSRRIFDCRVFGSADAAQLVTRFVSAKWAACGSPDRECTRRPDHRDNLVRVFRGKHSARQFALVARHQFRRRDFVYLRRPDRHSDHHLCEVLRCACCRLDHRNFLRLDCSRRNHRRSAFQCTRLDSPRDCVHQARRSTRTSFGITRASSTWLPPFSRPGSCFCIFGRGTNRALARAIEVG